MIKFLYKNIVKKNKFLLPTKLYIKYVALNNVKFFKSQLLNLSFFLGHNKNKWCNKNLFFIVGFRFKLAILNFDYILFMLNKGLMILNKIILFYGHVFGLSNFFNYGFFGVVEFFFKKIRFSFFDGKYLGGVVSNFFSIKRAYRNKGNTFISKYFFKYVYVLPSFVLIFDSNEFYNCFFEASYQGIPALGFLDSDLSFEHCLYPVVSNNESVYINLYMLIYINFFSLLRIFFKKLRYIRYILKIFFFFFKNLILYYIVFFKKQIYFFYFLIKCNYIDFFVKKRFKFDVEMPDKKLNCLENFFLMPFNFEFFLKESVNPIYHKNRFLSTDIATLDFENIYIYMRYFLYKRLKFILKYLAVFNYLKFTKNNNIVNYKLIFSYKNRFFFSKKKKNYFLRINKLNILNISKINYFLIFFFRKSFNIFFWTYKNLNNYFNAFLKMKYIFFKKKNYKVFDYQYNMFFKKNKILNYFMKNFVIFRRRQFFEYFFIFYDFFVKNIFSIKRMFFYFRTKMGYIKKQKSNFWLYIYILRKQFNYLIFFYRKYKLQLRQVFFLRYYLKLKYNLFKFSSIKVLNSKLIKKFIKKINFFYKKIHKKVIRYKDNFYKKLYKFYKNFKNLQILLKFNFNYRIFPFVQKRFVFTFFFKFLVLFIKNFVRLTLQILQNMRKRKFFLLKKKEFVREYNTRLYRLEKKYGVDCKSRETAYNTLFNEYNSFYETNVKLFRYYLYKLYMFYFVKKYKIRLKKSWLIYKVIKLRKLRKLRKQVNQLILTINFFWKFLLKEGIKRLSFKKFSFFFKPRNKRFKKKNFFFKKTNKNSFGFNKHKFIKKKNQVKLKKHKFNFLKNIKNKNINIRGKLISKKKIYSKLLRRKKKLKYLSRKNFKKYLGNRKTKKKKHFNKFMAKKSLKKKFIKKSIINNIKN